MAVTKLDLTKHLWETMGLTSREASHLVDLFFKTMREAITAKGELQLSSFGIFSVLEKKARPGRNPKTGHPYEIKARRVVTFSASQSLRAHCNPELPNAVFLRSKNPAK